MELLWMSMLLVPSRISAVQDSTKVYTQENDDVLPWLLHILEEGNLLVLTLAGLTQMLNETCFLMVLFHECPPLLEDNPFSKGSQMMAKELGKAVEIMGKGKNVVGFGKVDIMVEKELWQEFNADLEEEAAEMFFDMIKDFPELTFGVTSIGNATGHFYITLNSVMVFKKGRVLNHQELINDSINKSILNQVIRQHLKDFVIEYNTEILFILVNTAEPRNGHIFEYFRITEVDVPSVQILNLSSNARYKMPAEEITYKNLKKFGHSFLNGSAKKHQSSEDIPKHWDQGPVKQLVGKNFNIVVFDKERDMFVMFYVPWSEKCMALFPLLEELGRKYQNHFGITISKMDITANDVQLTYLEQCPFFRLFPTDSEQAVIYGGEHTVKGFSVFLESQIKTRVEYEDEILFVDQRELIEEDILPEEEEEVYFEEKELLEHKLPGLEEEEEEEEEED